MDRAEDQSLPAAFNGAVLWGTGRAAGKAVGGLPGTTGIAHLKAWPRGFM